MIASEVPAGAGARGVYGAGKSCLIPVFSQERAGLRICSRWQGIGEEILIFGCNMDRKQFVGDPVPAVIIPV